jgi:3-oxoadipate enol-lactonase
MPYLDKDGRRLHWQESGSGTPLLLIMGASYSSRLWYPAVPTLSGKHRVLTFDNRGTGESTATKVASISDMARDALAVLDAAGVEKAHVYGVSLGGVVAQQVALEAPERVTSLVLGCTGILSADKPRAPKAVLWLYRLPKRVRTAIGKKASGYGPACPPDRAAADLVVLRADTNTVMGLMQQQNALRAYSVSLEQVAALTMLALVLHGDADSVVPHVWGEELAATLPDARFISYPGAGHNYLVAVGERRTRTSCPSSPMSRPGSPAPDR